MDLRSVLNTSENGERGQTKAPPMSQQQQQSRASQNPAQYPYRDYPQPPPHPSPGKSVSQDYPRHPQQPQPHQSPNVYPPPSPYQNVGQQYATRPPQSLPAHHSSSFHDPRSPGGIPVTSQSPYRPGPTSASSSSASMGYPFPPTQTAREMASPSPRQQHHYPPGPQAQQHKHDSFAHRDAEQPSGYMQQHQVPQTPPISAAAVSSQQYLHQRSQSAQSTPTPTSAQSQHHFNQGHTHGSPIQTPRSSTEYRHPSQPPTPLGPPRAASARHPPGLTTSFPQPPSPYQQRVTSVSSQQSQSPASANVPLRRISGPSYQESPASDPHRRSRSLQEREQSLSVSPRTRVASVATNSDRDMVSPTNSDKKLSVTTQGAGVDTDNIATPAKRKLDDRNLSPKELEHKGSRPPPGELNGSHGSNSRPMSSSAPPRQKRIRRLQPPIWAQSARTLGDKMPNSANLVLQKRAHSHLNGNVDDIKRIDQPSQDSSPDAARTSTSAASKPALPTPESGPQDILGPWEASITGVKPYEEMSKSVADFIFIHVVNNPDIKEIMSRGIQFEIEAKLGTLIDKDTNYRVDRLLDSECILHDNGRVAFKSSMTEVHHKSFNDFLNQIVIQTDPRAPNNTGRVQVHYKHRREVDRYFELTPELQSRLPGCVLSKLNSRSRNVKARVTYDQKTGQALAKIIKARVADIDIHMPLNPMDCRLSINLEMDWDGSVDELEKLGPVQNDKTLDRQKDRLSYTQGHYQVDLTQVTTTITGPGNTQRSDKEHELEIELASPIVLDQGGKAMSGAPHRYQELIEGLLDNVRVLARKARDFP